MRDANSIDALLNEMDRGLRTLFAPRTLQQRSNPADALQGTELTETERKHSAGLMRVNHAGEVAAQALYFGHAAGVSDPKIKHHMLEAADEEADHLAWCTERLQQLHSQPSVFGPLWYSGAYGLGWLSGRVSTMVALGFVAETEAQVEAHLADHELRLPQNDQASLAIVKQMREEEARHGAAAKAKGGIALPTPVRWLMGRSADFMRAVAYRI